LEDEGCVDDVLCCRAPVHPAPVLGRTLAERAYERHERVLRGGDSVAQRREVVERGVALRPDALGRRCGNDSDLSLGLSEGTLHVEPGLDERAGVEQRTELGCPEEIAQKLAVECRGHGLRQQQSYD
jgi:hypothetical protein